jgi:hypothetical protein
MCRTISPILASAKILARQACYRPVTRDRLPLIGRVPGVAGAYIATGHARRHVLQLLVQAQRLHLHHRLVRADEPVSYTV